MKLLIAYDGSQSSKDAIQDLRYAGLPVSGVEATVLSVGEVRMPAEPAFNLEPTLPIVTYALENTQDALSYAREATEKDAAEGAEDLARLFPQWTVKPCARLNSPASSILEVAETSKPDLIVMGSHGRSGFKRLFLGSVSLRVLTEAKTSVRITRSKLHLDGKATPVILLAFDGSRGARNTVHQLLHRTWPAGTKLHIVTVIDVSILSTPEYIWLVGDDLGQYQEMKESNIQHALHSLEREMQKRFSVTTAMPVGHPPRELLLEAKRVAADTIFIGSRGLSRFERLLLGSVAHSIAANAEATVEIVR
ncbi:MAG: universal stress protein [Bacteroidota bacterium]|nr:universal stress protein [Bacteroidota bacterium]MDP4232470.1 universal stress protein [Bacteroidota bacterium]MDP4241606.1 universal stress protein [Bacteroidota bacterium]MDP4286350.1 universal stress protein [Bacteroidota bacterium]